MTNKADNFCFLYNNLKCIKHNNENLTVLYDAEKMLQSRKKGQCC